MIRLKFLVESVSASVDGNRVILKPQYFGSKENEKIFTKVPAGSIDLETLNRNIEFQPGQEYYVDITPVGI